MTQEFAKTPILGQPGKIRPRSFPRRNQKKLAFFFIFLLSSFLKKKQFPIISPFKSRKSLMRKKLQCVTRRRGNFLYI